MVKFLSVLGSLVVIVTLLSLLWPRFSANPRPEALARVHAFVLSTTFGKNAAQVLGVSDDQTVLPLTPKYIADQVLTTVRVRVSDVIITHAVREISKRFRDLPVEEQSKVLNAFSEAIVQDESEILPTEDFPDASENGTEGDNTTAQ